MEFKGVLPKSGRQVEVNLYNRQLSPNQPIKYGVNFSSLGTVDPIDAEYYACLILQASTEALKLNNEE